MTRHRNAPPSQRQLRVGEEIRHVLAAVIERGEMADPELRDIPITVTEVRVSPDLRHAVAYATRLGESLDPALLAALNRAAPFFRAHIARAVRLKFVPSVCFEVDTSFERASRIDAILHRPSVARDLAPHEEEPPGEGEEGVAAKTPGPRKGREATDDD
ncbi:MAG: 30S ribosome-binding factor RbfA [Alphaproteobacteria bacterium]